NKTKQLIREFLKGFDDDPPPSPPSGGDGGPTPPTTPPKGDIEGTNPKGNEPQNPSTDTTKGEGEGDTSPKGNIEDTGTDFKAIAHELYTKAQAQEGGFRGLLESIPGQHELEADNLLKGVESLERKLKSKQGDIGAISDFLRAAFKVENRAQLNAQLMAIEDTLRAEGINPVIEFHHRSSKYKGLHIQFDYNGVASEIQLHTSKSWGIKKELDPIYHITRDPQALAKLSYEEVVALKKQSQQIAQDLDLDISDLTSYAVKSFNAQNSEKSVLVRKSPTLGNDTQDSLEKSNSKLFSSEVDTAYNRPDSALSENSSLSGDSGNIQTPKADSTTTPLKIEANPAFGENFAAYAGKGAEAVKKLLQEKRGQVSGAFYREGLGYIDIIWGSAGGMGDKAKGVGLSKILEKHIDDFTPFQGDTPQEKLINGLSQIVQNGELVINSQDVKTIILKKGGKEFRAGLSQGWDGQGKNHWIITAYELKHPPLETSDQSRALVGHGNNLAQKDDLKDSTSPLSADLSPQEMKQAVKKWDLTNPKPTDSLDFALVKDPELTELQEVFNTDKLIRQIRSAEVKDTLDKGFSLKEVLDYTSHLPTAQRNILGDELHYTKPLENGKTLNIVETYKAPKTLRFSRMDVVEDRGVATAQRQIDNPTPPKGDNPPPKGNEPQNPTSGLEQAWLETFGLKSLDEPFIPKFSPEVAKALEPVLKGEQIQLTQGSLIKLEKRQREEFLPLIRPTLEEPNAVLDDGKGLLFIKEFIDPDKNRYFMSVAKNYDGEWVFSSHVRKDFSGIKKKFADSKVLYNAGFKGGEVAGASDILESGGTAVKPSDLQIDTPPNRGSGLNPTGKDTTQALKIEANPEFGENFAEYAGKGAEAVKKLLQEKRGQVSGAFYRQDLGYIDLVWGNYELKAAPGAKKPKSYGLSKILEKHAKDFESFKGADVGEKLANGLEYLIESGELKESPTKIKTIVVPTEQGEFRVGLSKGWMGEGENTWVITAYEYKNPPVETFGQSTSSKEVSKESGHGHLAQKDLADSTTTPLKAQEDATPKSAEELIESLAVDNATAKKYNKHYPHDPRYILSDQHEAFKKLFGIKEGDDPFTPNMP
ncbi:putative barnase/colicin E5 family endoribonuclease, partial [Helicobacter ailurogastricus]|uniref:putative barnase/colicin E5 family endoribonuclease n=1 Tax=Helicobacter ailurogastricus TaxID=1578720 RepID=UPI0022797C63